jgi:hypothetical protein
LRVCRETVANTSPETGLYRASAYSVELHGNAGNQDHEKKLETKRRLGPNQTLTSSPP